MDSDGMNERRLPNLPDGPTFALSWYNDRHIGFVHPYDARPFDLYRYDLRSKRATRIATIDLHLAGKPKWTANGEWIVMLAAPPGESTNVYAIRSDGSDFHQITDIFMWSADSITVYDPRARSVSAIGKRPFTWGWLKQLASPTDAP